MLNFFSGCENSRKNRYRLLKKLGKYHRILLLWILHDFINTLSLPRLGNKHRSPDVKLYLWPVMLSSCSWHINSLSLSLALRVWNIAATWVYIDSIYSKNNLRSVFCSGSAFATRLHLRYPNLNTIWFPQVPDLAENVWKFNDRWRYMQHIYW